MIHSGVHHHSSLQFRQPLARNRLRFRLLAASGDLESCHLVYWKRSIPQVRHTVPMQLKFSNAELAEWRAEIEFPEEAHYIKYDFLLKDQRGQVQYYNALGFHANVPESGHFELLQVHESEIPSQPGWSRGCVYYQIFPDRFCKGPNPASRRIHDNWDAIPGRDNYLGGNLEGIRQKIPYLKDLGVDCLYLTPVFHADFNHKYATIDYFKIDPDFGTEEDLKNLVQEAHQSGIRVILDAVFNHVGVSFPPFQTLMEEGRQSAYHDWFYPKEYPVHISEKHYECVGDYAPMPRLRVVNPQVREYLSRVLLYWLDNVRIDGWRFDVADELDPSAVRYWRQVVKQRYPEALFLAETWGDASALVYDGSQFDSAMNYLFRDLALEYFARRMIDEKELDSRIHSLLMKYSDETTQCMYNCIGSHDTARFLSECQGDQARLKLAFAFLLMFPGSPAIYYGDELGMQGENDPDCRAGMDWQHGDMSIHGWVRKLIRLRKHSKAVLYGDFRICLVDRDLQLYAFERRYQEEKVLVVFNQGPGHQQLNFAGWRETVDISSNSVEIIMDKGGKP